MYELGQAEIDVVRAEQPPFSVSPSADPEGDCGNNATLIFESAAFRENVARRAKELHAACRLDSPTHHGLHVYTNWTVGA